MEIKNIEDIRQMKPKPCYDPGRVLPENWQGTVMDILINENIPVRDRIWVVCYEGWIDDRTMRLFAVWCAREALKLVNNPDSRSIEACNKAERFVEGNVTKKELYKVWLDATKASNDANGNVAMNAQISASWVVADAQASIIARAAIPYAAMASAWAENTGEIRDTVWELNRNIAEIIQLKKLIEMIESEGVY